MANKKLVGFVGWRGMVGSVLMQRMWEEQDFSKHYQGDNFDAVFLDYIEQGLSFDALEVQKIVKDFSECFLGRPLLGLLNLVALP